MSRADFFLTLCRWLACAALLDLFIGRTLTRAAIHMPKSPFLLLMYQAVGVVGQFAFTVTGVLALVTLGVLIWRTRRQWYGGLSLVLVGLGVSSLVFVVVPPTGWLGVGYHTLVLAAVALIGAQARRSAELRVWIVPAMAVVCGELYALSAALSNTLAFNEPAALNLMFFNLGEGFIVASSFVLWWALARGRANLRIWVLAFVPALAFAAMYLANPSITGIMSIWSMGLSLWLPWPLYALSIWLVTITLLVSWRGEGRIAFGILLFVASGYAPQLSAHAFLGLIGLWLLATSKHDLTESNVHAANRLAFKPAHT